MCPSIPPADDHPEPFSPLIPGRGGRPSYSLEALRELVERQFRAETAGRADILRALETPDDQRALLAEIADYVLAVESITLDRSAHATLIAAAHTRLFGFGPLDPLIADDAVTEIAVDGPNTLAARRGMDRLEGVAARFDDAAHLTDVIERILSTSDDASPSTASGTVERGIVERGITLQGRPARLTVVTPPLSAAISLQLRLHPRQPIALDALRAQFSALPAEAVTLLDAILRAGWGVLIAGEAGTGKTTLAGALAARLPPDAPLIAVERAAELSLPGHAARKVASEARPFADTLSAALDRSPGWLLVDELRGDISDGLWNALSHAPEPRGLWVWRGAVQPDRLRSALNIAIRREQPALPQADIDAACAACFPFVAALKMTTAGARLAYLAENRLDGGALRLAPLLTLDGGAWRMTGEQPMHALDLGEESWAEKPY